MTQTMETMRSTRVKMQTEWDEERFQVMHKAITNHFRNKLLLTHTEIPIYFNKQVKFSLIDRALGLAYTSSGMFACYGVCNTEAYIDEDRIFKYEFFTLGDDGQPYAILWDKNENELCIRL